MSDVADLLDSDLRELRRDLHRHPEPAWCEFYTTARLIEALAERDVELQYGRDIHNADARLNVPDKTTRTEWINQALEAGADKQVVDEMEAGFTGVLAVLKRGPGPTIALRVDIDGLPITEADAADHQPAAEGFRSEHEGYMHACGHDAHATIGLGVLDAVLESDFSGTFKLIFQPGEEQISGAKPIAESGVIDDVEYLLAHHIGLDHPSGQVVAGIDDFLAVTQFRAEFVGESAHAGARPEAGANAVQAMAAAVQNLYAIPRHADGATRVNAGRVGGGTADNIVPEHAFIKGEVRGETTALMSYMWNHAQRVIGSAADMHACKADIELLGEAPSAKSDQQIVEIVGEVAGRTPGVIELIERDSLGGSEDATFLMQHVQNQGGLAAYVGVGTDHPGGHHTPTFDVDEQDIAIAIGLLSETIQELAIRQP